MNDLAVLINIGEQLGYECLEYDQDNPSPLCYLLDEDKNIRSLFLFSLRIETIPKSIFKLNKLEDLRIHNANIIYLPEDIGELKNLKSLSLFKNKIEYVPKHIGRLSKLSLLSFHSNKLNTLPAEVGDLTNLKKLILDNNHICCLPPEIGKCTNLSILRIEKNEIEYFPKTIGKLKNLVFIDAENNKLNLFPKEIEKLKSLRSLWLSGNNIEYVPSEIKYLKNLVELYIDRNPIKSLSPDVSELMKLRRFSINWNNIEDIPITIINKGTDEVFNYLKNEEGHQQQLFTNEAKLIIVGEGEVGKTCLVNRLKYNEFFEEKATKGIDVSLLKLKAKDNLLSEIYLHIWDFAGQEISHTTHLFFLTKDSVYLLVWNARQPIDHIYKWLEWIKAFGQNSPVILVMSKCNELDGDLNIAQLRETYPNIKGYLKIDSKDGTGINDLKEKIAKLATNLPILKKPWKYSWYKFLRKIEEINSKWIEYDVFKNLSESFKIDKNELDFIDTYLNSLVTFKRWGKG